MLKSSLIIGAIVLATLDFFLFKAVTWAFWLHNVLAGLVGVGLIYSSFYLYKKNKTLAAVNAVVGVGMLAIHLTKLFVGKCL
tara:strand:- start:41 stop:286 length:246 start_codon:yes stop_codon:yes gene_type:complete